MGMRVYNRPKAIWINLAFKKLSWDPHQKSWLLSHWPEFTYLYKRGYEIHVLAGYIAVLKIIRVLLVRKKKKWKWILSRQPADLASTSIQRILLQCRRPWFDYWVRKICWRRDRLPTPVFLGFPCGSAGKESAHNAGDQVRSLGWKDSLEKGKATHSSILAWRIPRIPWSVGSQRVGHHWVTFAFSYNCLFIWYMYIMLQFYG